LVVVETELWPALIWESKKGRVPVFLVNARISPDAFSRYMRFRRWLGPLLQTFRTIQAQSETDAERFLALGAPPERVSVVGNLKFDLTSPNPSAHPARALRRARAGGWRVIVAGSTHPGEEAAVLDAVDRLVTQDARVGLVLAPRHLERLAEVERLILAQGKRVRRWGELPEPLEAGILSAFDADEIVLVDRYGILDCLYGGSECAFVGGSLAPVGGHNLLEPLNWGVPVVFGPHTENMLQIRNEVVRRGLGTEVKGPSELAEALWRYLNEPALADQVRDGSRALFAAHRGAVDQALKALGESGVPVDSGSP
jgi:3-deoxy-D-manno-octulosonic-acid transferase